MMELEEIIEQQLHLEQSLEQLGHSLKQDLCSQQSSEDEGNQLLINNNSSSRSSKKIQKSSSNCNLKICRDSHKIMKRASVPLPAVQYRRPIIIHTYSPKVLHIEPSKFMWLVQSLTGSSETRSRCWKSRPAELNTDAAAAAKATIDADNHGNTHAQYASSSSSSSPHDHDPAHNSGEACDLYPQQSSAPHNHSQEYLPQPNHISNPNPVINDPHDHLITSGFSPNPANDFNYYCSHNIEDVHQLFSSCRSSKDVSPRGPLSATEFEDASAFSSTPPPAPAFDHWSFDNLDNNISTGFLQGPCSLNYLSNLSVTPPNLSGNNDFPSNYTINATPWAVDSLLISNTAIPSPCIFRQIPIWDNPLDTILYPIREL